jgi:hypothetical protein
MNHLGDTNKMVSDTPRTDAKRGFHDLDTAVDAEFSEQLECELNAANERIKRLEEAGNALLWYFCPKNTGDISFLQSEAIKQWNKAKEDKP